MEQERSSRSAFSHIAAAAIFSVVLLGFAVFFQSQKKIVASNLYPNTSPTNPQEAATDFTLPADEGVQDKSVTDIGSDIIASLNQGMSVLQTEGANEGDTGISLAESIGASIHPTIAYPQHSIQELTITIDTSADGASQYRSDLQGALAPLLKNPDAEFAVYGEYVETKDPQYLAQLQSYAANYRASVQNLASLTVPTDAAGKHVALMNALDQFAATLDSLASHAEDPFASAALLTTYNSAESDMLASFNSIALYFKAKLS